MKQATHREADRIEGHLEHLNNLRRFTSSIKHSTVPGDRILIPAEVAPETLQVIRTLVEADLDKKIREVQAAYDAL